MREAPSMRRATSATASTSVSTETADRRDRRHRRDSMRMKLTGISATATLVRDVTRAAMVSLVKRLNLSAVSAHSAFPRDVTRVAIVMVVLFAAVFVTDAGAHGVS